MTLINYLTRVHFADDVLEEALRSELQAASKSRPLIVAAEQDLHSTNGERFLSGLPLRCKTTTFGDIPIVPTEVAAGEVAKRFHDHDCDVIVAFGSDRAINLAKAARVALAHKTEFSNLSFSLAGPARIQGEPLKDLIAVPDISGTAAAANAQTPVILKSGHHALLVSRNLIPTVTICDPTLTLEASPAQTAASAADAITGCIEACLSKSYNPPAEGIALDGLKRAIRNLKIVLKDGSDLASRREMMAANLNGALARQKGFGASDAISSALVAVSKKPLDKGSLNRCALPQVLAFNQEAAAAKYVSMRDLFGIKSSVDFARGVDQFFDCLPLPKRLSEMDLDQDDFHQAAELAEHTYSSGTNPRSVAAADYHSMMMAAY